MKNFIPIKVIKYINHAINVNVALKTKFTAIAQDLTASEKTIVNELNGIQGSPVNIDGYYYPNAEKVATAMRPSGTLNEILAQI